MWGSMGTGRRVRSSRVPFRRSRSRSPATGVSIVTTSAAQPAACARAMAAEATSRPPTRYSWYQTGPEVAALTSPSSGAGERGKDVGRAGASRGGGRRRLSPRMEHPAAPDRGEQERQFQ